MAKWNRLSMLEEAREFLEFRLAARAEVGVLTPKVD
jgi:hypothetical protein